MKDLYSQKVDMKDENGLYFIYRDVYFDYSDKLLLEKNKMRYDITILLPRKI
jgi:hypothetical protein